MSTNNCVNIKQIGVVSYDGAGNFAGNNPIGVSLGGLGVASNTSYALLAAGASSTAAIQNLSGTTGQSLVSQGAGNLPVWQDFGEYLVFTYNFISTTLADSTTYYWQSGSALVTSAGLNRASTIRKFPRDCEAVCAYGLITVGGTIGSGETITLSTLEQQSTANTIATFTADSASIAIVNTSLTGSASAGNTLQIRLVTPALATNPTQVRGTLTVVYQ